LVDATEQQLFADDESEDGDYSPRGTESPVKREGSSDEHQIPDDPESQQARPFPRVPLGTLVHRLFLAIQNCALNPANHSETGFPYTARRYEPVDVPFKVGRPGQIGERNTVTHHVLKLSRDGLSKH
jgi:hypothetical protein